MAKPSFSLLFSLLALALGKVWTLFLFIPAITMRSLAEEKRSGTIELLSTKAITDWEIVVGKFFGALMLILISLACTSPFYFTVSSLGNIDHGGVIGGYLGLFLAAFLAATVLPLSSEVVLGILLAQEYNPVFAVGVATVGNVLGAVIKCAKTDNLLTVGDSRIRIGLFHNFVVVYLCLS